MTDLYNPFTGETVTVSKTDIPPTKVRSVASLVPTGKHVSHVNDLFVVRRGRRKNVGRYGDTALRTYRGHHAGGVGKRDLSDLGDLSRQPGMVNPGVVTSSWSHGTPNQNFAAASGRRGRKIA